METAQEFQKLRINTKITHLNMAGEFIAERIFLNNRVHLYLYNGYFVEVWMRIGFEEVYAVDVAPTRSVRDAYLGKIDLKKLGLDL